jgi:hypothetical protein
MLSSRFSGPTGDHLHGGLKVFIELYISDLSIAPHSPLTNTSSSCPSLSARDGRWGSIDRPEAAGGNGFVVGIEIWTRKVIHQSL